LVAANVTAVVRSANERTEALCYKLLCEQVPSENIVVVKECPFTSALQRSFQLGIECGRPWTLCIDADVLLRRNSVPMLLNWARSAADNVFQIQVNLIDKMFGGPRKAGLRLYRSSLLSKAVACIPADGVSVRPETSVRDQMKALGYLTMYKTATVGLHDFEQYYRDIYRKAIVHAHKHTFYAGYFERFWTRLAGHDPDYQVALWGLRAGQLSNGRIRLDVRCFPQDIGRLLSTKGLQEKRSLQFTALNSPDIDKLITDYYRTRVSVAHNYQ